MGLIQSQVMAGSSARRQRRQAPLPFPGSQPDGFRLQSQSQSRPCWAIKAEKWAGSRAGAPGGRSKPASDVRSEPVAARSGNRSSGRLPFEPGVALETAAPGPRSQPCWRFWNGAAGSGFIQRSLLRADQVRLAPQAAQDGCADRRRVGWDVRGQTFCSSQVANQDRGLRCRSPAAADVSRSSSRHPYFLWPRRTPEQAPVQGPKSLLARYHSWLGALGGRTRLKNRR